MNFYACSSLRNPYKRSGQGSRDPARLVNVNEITDANRDWDDNFRAMGEKSLGKKMKQTK